MIVLNGEFGMSTEAALAFIKKVNEDESLYARIKKLETEIQDLLREVTE